MENKNVLIYHGRPANLNSKTGTYWIWLISCGIIQFYSSKRYRYVQYYNTSFLNLSSLIVVFLKTQYFMTTFIYFYMNYLPTILIKLKFWAVIYNAGDISLCVSTPHDQNLDLSYIFRIDLLPKMIANYHIIVLSRVRVSQTKYMLESSFVAYT